MSWARYLRAVHVEWCPWKPKALAPPWFQYVSTPKVLAASPKLSITKALVDQPPAATDFVDRTQLTFADGSKQQLDFNQVGKLRDILELIDQENGRISQEEAKRGKPFS